MPHIAPEDKTPFKFRWFTSDDLVELDFMPIDVRDAVVAAILARRNILVSGETGSGKSTLLKALVDHIPPYERVLVIERLTEFELAPDNCTRWETVDELLGRPAITVAHLLRSAVRDRYDRIVIGEIRDDAAFDMLQAMIAGQSAWLTATNAGSARQALDRISDLALSAHPNLDRAFLRAQTADAFHYVLHTERGREWKRRVAEFLKVTGYDSDRNSFELETLYRFPAEVSAAFTESPLRIDPPNED